MATSVYRWLWGGGELEVSVGVNWQTTSTQTITVSATGGNSYDWRLGIYQEGIALAAGSVVYRSDSQHEPWVIDSAVKGISFNVPFSGTTRFYGSKERRCP